MATERITSFTFEKHDGPYESWPSRTRLLSDSKFTGRKLCGYVIEAQFRIGSRYLVVTSDDCPFEEITRFYLLSESFRVLSSRWKGVPYDTWLLESIEPSSHSSFDISFGGDETWVLAIRDRRRFYFGSYLSLRRTSGGDETPALLR